MSLNTLWFKSAPATFIPFVHKVLYSTAPELKNYGKVCLDDILIHTKDLEFHQAVCDHTCQILVIIILAINLHKSIFASEIHNYVSWFRGKC